MSKAAGPEDAMTAATLIHPLATLLRPRPAQARRDVSPRRGPRTHLRGALVLALVYGLLAGTFLYDLARPVL
jgi:hypothetical protein